MTQFAFGGNTGLTYEDLKRRQLYADQMMMNGSRGAPKTAMEGANRAAQSVMGALLARRLGKEEQQGQSRADAAFQRAIGGGYGNFASNYRGNVGGSSAPAAPRDPLAPGVIAQDTLAALGKDLWADNKDVQAGIFAGESGGDYDALFGFSNRPGGRYANVKPTDMTVSEVSQFTDPSGDYGQWVKGQVGRVATPVGAYQGVGTTIRAAVDAGVLDPGEKFDQAAQDRFGKWVLSTQGTGAWEGYRGPQSGGGGQQYAQAGGGISPDMLQAMSNPYMSEQQRSVLGMLIQQQLQLQQAEQEQAMQAQDPYRQAQIRNIESQIAERSAPPDASDATLGSQEILDDGTIIQSTSTGPRVYSPDGTLITGQAAADKIREARDYTVQNQRDIYGARREGTLGADIEMGGTAASAVKGAEAAVNQGEAAYEGYRTVQSSLGTINEAIAAIDEGAESGMVYNMLPNITLASASLSNAMDRMGLDVIGSVTFGALSAGEMRLAMETAAPRNLRPPELREWLVGKRDAQEKAAATLQDAAIFLMTPGNTVPMWIEKNKAAQSGQTGRTAQSAPQPAAAAQQPPAQSSPAAAAPSQFSGMDMKGLGAVDLSTLSDEELSAWDRRYEELAQ